MIGITFIHLNKILNYLSIPSINCCLKSSSSSSSSVVSLQDDGNEEKLKMNVIEIVDYENHEKQINEEIVNIECHDTLIGECDKISFKEISVCNTTPAVNNDHVDGVDGVDEDDDININKLFPTFLNNLKKQQEEIEIADKLNIDDKLVDDPIKLYSNDVMLKKLEKIDDSRGGSSLKKGKHHVGMNDDFTRAFIYRYDG